jgi:hypothetical protein
LPTDIDFKPILSNLEQVGLLVNKRLKFSTGKTNEAFEPEKSLIIQIDNKSLDNDRKFLEKFQLNTIHV